MLSFGKIFSNYLTVVFENSGVLLMLVMENCFVLGWWSIILWIDYHFVMMKTSCRLLRFNVAMVKTVVMPTYCLPNTFVSKLRNVYIFCCILIA